MAYEIDSGLRTYWGTIHGSNERPSKESSNCIRLFPLSTSLLEDPMCFRNALSNKNPNCLLVTIESWDFYSTQMRPSINILLCGDIPFRDRKAINTPNFVQMHFVFPFK